MSARCRSARHDRALPRDSTRQFGAPRVAKVDMVETRLSPDAMAAIVARTLDHYDERADAFWEGTRDHDVSQNIQALLQYIEGSPPFTILDLGCGPGRDLRTLAELGHTAIGIDGVERFAAMARDHSGCEVWQQDFLKLDLPAARFDGVFANAALFHVPSQELPRVLGELRATLKPRGVLFSSNPHGEDEEGWNRGRYGAYHRIETWRRYVSTAGFVELAHYYRPEGLPREQQPWLATVWRKAEPAAGDAAVRLS
jgi:SAM-dependent methyltransferase